MKKYFYASVAFLSFQISIAQQTEIKVEMLAANWDVPKDAIFETFENKKTLLLKNGRAVVKNQKITNGTIEVDVYANTIRSFAGITFRKQNNNMEEVYMRLHKANQADAVQYTPIFNNESNWQLFREHQAKISFKNAGWNTLKIEVDGKNAVVFVNNKKVLTINNLITAQNTGEIGLFALFTNRFANFRFTPRETTKNAEAKDNDAGDPSIIREWKITKAIPYLEEELNFKNFYEEKYSAVTTEKSGLLVLSKYLKKTSSGNFEGNKEDYTIATTTLFAKNDETKLFSFDYSDKIIVYLNGKRIFKGNNAFRTKGVQYMGHIDINTNMLYLDLKKGTNKLHCVVIDKANGWGLIGKVE